MLHASFPFSILQYVRNSLVYTLHKIMFRLEWRNVCFFRSREGYFGVFLKLRSSGGNEYHDTIRMNA